MTDDFSIPRVLAILPGFTPSTLMDVVNPLLRLDRKGGIQFQVTLEFYTRLANLQSADLIVFCRNTDPRYTHILDEIERRQLPFIYDLDDNLFQLSLNTELGRYHRDPQRINFLARYLRQAGLVRVYSPQLFDQVKQYSSSAAVVTPPLDWNLISAPDRPGIPGPVKLVYATSRKEDPLFSIFQPALERILKEYGSRVQMVFLGFLPEPFRNAANVFYEPFQASYNEYLRKFSRQGYDIGLAPLLDDEFHRAKTNNKFREYSACSMAGVYSNVEVYAGCVQNGETGILVENTADGWYQAIKLLIDDEDLRRRIGKAAQAYVKEHYSVEKFGETWLDQIRRVVEKKTEPASISPGTPDQIERIPGTRRAGGWMGQKFQLARQRLAAQGGSALWNSARLQLENLWMLYKINTLKKL